MFTRKELKAALKGDGHFKGFLIRELQRVGLYSKTELEIMLCKTNDMNNKYKWLQSMCDSHIIHYHNQKNSCEISPSEIENIIDHPIRLLTHLLLDCDNFKHRWDINGNTIISPAYKRCLLGCIKQLVTFQAKNIR
jgi:hypothetical protein